MESAGHRHKIEIRDLNVYYGSIHALRGVNLVIHANEILGIIGPANSGKSSLLRAINRLPETPDARYEGKILFDGADTDRMSLNDLRRKIGLIFASPVVLPGTIYKNLTYGPKLHHRYRRGELDRIVRESLTAANLWDEVKDRLNDSASTLSGGQQQRLCIARTLALRPEVIMMDEPCSGLDPISTAKVESAMESLKKDYTFVLVTNNTKQAARIGTRVAFFLSGQLVEIERTEKIFTTPKDKRTNDYISGRFG